MPDDKLLCALLADRMMMRFQMAGAQHIENKDTSLGTGKA